ncbi:Phosphoribosyl-AMP cyclohydrolase [Thermobaculum terrenum ATCC BAA-798]|uniref:Phosphoribosyl-AMP cyclohydrolase n=1 Tax=Thermobaculum terrenum (strain ATCC BAA-798 / CCMEE 7001 / YNP1) TaxID=525904 RepID=D1CF76_THET1|nr:phosphoribosyl-AMP cyclohydrolase [Thermobaculum terrenum]ACZ41582.1 Phosphoribosyl-AMP cyclohydrolase [Thermobaculum terrenum ATCC BAA-798]
MRDTSKAVNLVDMLQYDEHGLLPVVVQDAATLKVLLVAFMNREALERTLSTGLVHFWSRSRKKIWLKGETSGRTLHVRELRPNCELNSLLILVDQRLPGACHTGHFSCFYRRLEDGELVEIEPPLFDPEDVYSDLSVLLGAYDWLSRQPTIDSSSTSKILHGAGPDPWARLLEEWQELLGVLEGTHVHKGYYEDAKLEAYQVLYWTCLCYVLLDDRPSIEEIHGAFIDSEKQEVSQIEHLIAIGNKEHNRKNKLLIYWRALGTACRLAGLDPMEVVRSDLQDLLSKDYMAAFIGEASAPR